MRGILFALISLLVLNVPARAQTLGTETKTVTGVIDSVKWVRAGPPLYTYLKITLAADGGGKLECFVMKSTNHVTLDGTVEHGSSVVSGKRVELMYVTVSGGNEFLNGANAALSIKHLD